MSEPKTGEAKTDEVKTGEPTKSEDATYANSCIYMGPERAPQFVSPAEQIFMESFQVYGHMDEKYMGTELQKHLVDALRYSVCVLNPVFIAYDFTTEEQAAELSKYSNDTHRFIQKRIQKQLRGFEVFVASGVPPILQRYYDMAHEALQKAHAHPDYDACKNAVVDKFKKRT